MSDDEKESLRPTAGPTLNLTARLPGAAFGLKTTERPILRKLDEKLEQARSGEITPAELGRFMLWSVRPKMEQYRAGEITFDELVDFLEDYAQASFGYGPDITKIAQSRLPGEVYTHISEATWAEILEVIDDGLITRDEYFEIARRLFDLPEPLKLCHMDHGPAVTRTTMATPLCGRLDCRIAGHYSEET